MRKASKTEKALEAEISLVRFASGGEQGWSFRIEDSSSGCQMIEARLSDEQLGQLLGSRIAKTPIRYWANPNIGKVREHARILVPLTHQDFPVLSTPDGEREEYQAHLKRTIWSAQEAQGYRSSDGWTPETLDRFNGHRMAEGGRYEVSLHRYVDPS